MSMSLATKFALLVACTLCLVCTNGFEYSTGHVTTEEKQASRLWTGSTGAINGGAVTTEMKHVQSVGSTGAITGRVVTGTGTINGAAMNAVLPPSYYHDLPHIGAGAGAGALRVTVPETVHRQVQQELAECYTQGNNTKRQLENATRPTNGSQPTGFVVLDDAKHALLLVSCCCVIILAWLGYVVWNDLETFMNSMKAETIAAIAAAHAQSAQRKRRRRHNKTKRLPSTEPGTS